MTLLPLFLLISSSSSFILLTSGDPKIDLVNLNKNSAEEHPYCNTNECPTFNKVEDSSIQHVVKRIYEQSNWIATPIFWEQNGTCLYGDELYKYYHRLVTYFKGLNKMGLRLERTLPIRVVARRDPITNIHLCYVRFYIPNMDPLHPPAPIVTDVYVGVSQKQSCYVLSRRGGYRWGTIVKMHASLVKYLQNKKKDDIETNQLTVDIFSGYGIPKRQKYIEVLICEKKKSFYYDW